MTNFNDVPGRIRDLENLVNLAREEQVEFQAQILTALVASYNIDGVEEEVRRLIAKARQRAYVTIFGSGS